MICSGCYKDLPTDSFGSYELRRGRARRCYVCERKRNRERYRRNPEPVLERTRNYRRAVGEPERHGSPRIMYRVYQAIKRGDLVKQPCVVCGEVEVEAHHENYNRPLEVIWLCRKHHREIHWK